MDTVQSGILADVPPLSRYLTFSLRHEDRLKSCLEELGQIADGDSLVVGLGQSLVGTLDRQIDGLHPFPSYAAAGIDIPSTPASLWCWLRGRDRGKLFHQSRRIESLLSPALFLDDCIDSFTFDQNRDLSGYEDGTENPSGADAIDAAIVQNQGVGLDGSSFVAVQKWVHDFAAFDAMSTAEQDDTIGRRIGDNEEFAEAPESAHVKRSAQETFRPEAFILRRSMPWSEGRQGGLVFVAFGKSFHAFEAILSRMTGMDDGVSDALFNFTRPTSGSYFWCPPMSREGLDLSGLGL